MERYEKYKESGVKWNGEIPEGWEITKLVRTIEKLTNGYVENRCRTLNSE
jgi:hypothetical protein